MRTGTLLLSASGLSSTILQAADGEITPKEVGYVLLACFVYLRISRLDERWGAETSAKGTRFKLNRDMAGYHNSNRAEIDKVVAEPRIKISIESPDKLRTLGDLIHFDAVEFRFPKAKKPFLEDITFTVNQGGRCAFVGAVSVGVAAEGYL
jgi:ATP-binding cassette subfamily F protein 3